MRSFLRFPGGKSKHTGKILKFFDGTETEYREPFVGGGSVYLASEFPSYWINDIDPELSHLWRLVKTSPYTLIDLIEEHTPVLEHRGEKKRIRQAMNLWREVKEDTNHKKFPAGYRFLFLNRTCYSGVVTGGPIGGMEQRSNYPLSCRWSKEGTISRILQASYHLRNCKVTNFSWQKVVNNAQESTTMYLDPPYLDKGDQCYKYFFTLEDHEELHETMQTCPAKWVMTVDNCPELRALWSKNDAYELITDEWNYSMSDRVGKELFIISKGCL